MYGKVGLLCTVRKGYASNRLFDLRRALKFIRLFKMKNVVYKMGYLREFVLWR